jgi:hypothetical protein
MYGLRKRTALPFKNLDPFLYHFQQFFEHLSRIVTMDTASEEFRTNADETVILIAPIHDLLVLICHASHFCFVFLMY